MYCDNRRQSRRCRIGQRLQLHRGRSQRVRGSAHRIGWLCRARPAIVESTFASFLTRHPDNPITETGVLSEFTHHGLSSRLHGKRVDRVHHPLDPVLVAAPWVLAAGVAYLALRRVAGRTRN